MPPARSFPSFVDECDKGGTCWRLSGWLVRLGHYVTFTLQAAHQPQRDDFTVRYLVVPQAVPPGRPDLFHLNQRYPTVYADDRVRVLEVTDALPRAWIVHEARQTPRGETLAELAGGSVDPSQVALVEESPPPLARPADPSADRAVDIGTGKRHDILRRCAPRAAKASPCTAFRRSSSPG